MVDLKLRMDRYRERLKLPSLVLLSKTFVGDTYTILLHPIGLLQSLLALRWLSVARNDHVTMQRAENQSTKSGFKHI